MLKDFAALPRTKEKKPKVGIVGEIYVKYSPLANNHLNDFLLSEGCEPNVPGLLDFVLYCASDAINDEKQAALLCTALVMMCFTSSRSSR